MLPPPLPHPSPPPLPHSLFPLSPFSSFYLPYLPSRPSGLGRPLAWGHPVALGAIELLLRELSSPLKVKEFLPCPLQLQDEGPQSPAPASRKKSQERKSSLRGSSSHKKPGPEEPRRAGAAAAPSPEPRPPKRPSFLYLCVGGGPRASVSSSAGEQVTVTIGLALAMEGSQLRWPCPSLSSVGRRGTGQEERVSAAPPGSRRSPHGELCSGARTVLTPAPPLLHPGRGGCAGRRSWRREAWALSGASYAVPHLRASASAPVKQDACPLCV